MLCHYQYPQKIRERERTSGQLVCFFFYFFGISKWIVREGVKARFKVEVMGGSTTNLAQSVNLTEHLFGLWTMIAPQSPPSLRVCMSLHADTFHEACLSHQWRILERVRETRGCWEIKETEGWKKIPSGNWAWNF